jgi:dipeptidyl aminopeptidase/acylaminoacyl peptidase
LLAADPDQIGMWGHSMGGGVTTRVVTVNQDVDAAVLYAPMSGDERQNYEAIWVWLAGEMGAEELAVPEVELTRISPVYYYDQIDTPIYINHGRADELVPLRWSVATCDALRLLGKQVECSYYPDMPHTFYGEGDEEFIQNVRWFFDRFLKAQN